MKSILIILLSFAFLQTMLAQPTSPEDQEEVAEEELPVLYVFSGSDWCKPCIKLKKEVIDTPTFQDYSAQKLQIRIVDFPYKKANKLSKEEQAANNALAEQYNPEGVLPNMILVKNDQTLVAPLRSRNTKALLREIEALLGS